MWSCVTDKTLLHVEHIDSECFLLPKSSAAVDGLDLATFFSEIRHCIGLQLLHNPFSHLIHFGCK